VGRGGDEEVTSRNFLGTEREGKSDDGDFKGCGLWRCKRGWISSLIECGEVCVVEDRGTIGKNLQWEKILEKKGGIGGSFGLE